jgi:membrane fusion protein, multidrug efflux system
MSQKHMIMDKLNNYLGLIALSIALLGCSTQAADSPSEPSGQVSKLPVDAKIVRATPLLQGESVAGSVLANKEVTIASEVLKKVKSIHFKEGSHVSKGQLLYKLDDNDIRARLKQVQAEVKLASLTESRLSQLLKSESVRQEEHDVAQSKLQSLQAAEELLETELEKTNITAPFSGIVGITRVEEGSLVSPGQSLVTLQEQRNVRIQYTVAEKSLQHVKIGKQIFFSVSGEKERLSARISAIESGIDNQSRAITVHAMSSNTKGKLKPGMSARVYFSTVADNATGITVPTEALIPSAQGYSVFVVKNGAAKIAPVNISNRTETDALITSGLNDGDTVMISNILRSGDGTPVQVVSIK